MIDLGLLHYFLGFQIWHMVNGIFLYQPKYASYLLVRFHMSDCKESPTPFQYGVKLIVGCNTLIVDVTLYCQHVGNLIYLHKVNLISPLQLVWFQGLWKSLMKPLVGSKENSPLYTRNYILWCFLFEKGSNFTPWLHRF